jgi:hypothetical protein
MNIPRRAASTALIVLALTAAHGAVVAAMPADGAQAPEIPVLQSVLGGAYGPFDLKAASTGTTIVLYFFPEAFTSG